MTRYPLLPLLVVALFSGCASVEEPKPAAAVTPAASAAPAAPVVRPAERAAPPSAPFSSSAPARPQAGAAVRTTPSDRSVYFDYDKEDIKPEFHVVIEQNARYLRENPDVQARIEGNADERGSREYNLALGQRRAEAVMKRMSMLGVSEKRMEAVSYGEEKPRRTGHDESSWAENRRSDLVVQPAK